MLPFPSFKMNFINKTKNPTPNIPKSEELVNEMSTSPKGNGMIGMIWNCSKGFATIIIFIVYSNGPNDPKKGVKVLPGKRFSFPRKACRKGLEANTLLPSIPSQRGTTKPHPQVPIPWRFNPKWCSWVKWCCSRRTKHTQEVPMNTWNPWNPVAM